MPAVKPDPIADALNAAVATGSSATSSIERFFADRPAVTDSVKAAHKRGVPLTEIARLLTSDRSVPEGTRISDKQVKTWLDKHLPRTL